MTAIRVVTDHQELDNSGQVMHSELDTYITGSAFLVVSGTGPLPPAARRLVAGPGITISDQGPGGNLIISASAAGGIQWNEVPSGSNDGVNKQFILLFSPSPQSALMLFINGVKQRQGIDSDFTLTGSIINLTPATGYRSGSNIDATYPF
jgi:hypothetical protein